jgi:hypothetical protein
LRTQNIRTAKPWLRPHKEEEEEEDGVVVSVVIPATLRTALRRYNIDVLVMCF